MVVFRVDLRIRNGLWHELNAHHFLGLLRHKEGDRTCTGVEVEDEVGRLNVGHI